MCQNGFVQDIIFYTIISPFQFTIFISFLLFISENQERFFLYLFISVTVGVLLCLVLVIGRLLFQRRQLKKTDKKQQSMNSSGETTIPNGFSDDISEIDNDIDMTTSIPVPSVSRNEVIELKKKTQIQRIQFSALVISHWCSHNTHHFKRYKN